MNLTEKCSCKHVYEIFKIKFEINFKDQERKLRFTMSKKKLIKWNLKIGNVEKDAKYIVLKFYIKLKNLFDKV